MREVLFKGKRIDNGEWVYGGYKLEKVGEYIATVFIIEPLTDGVFENHRVIPETVGQYTGLTDKNGKKIFEGDIVRGAWETIFQVYCDDCYLRFRAKDKNGYCQDIDFYGLDMLEIIGNIHDNPELLK